MFYLVETQVIRENNVDSFKRIIYLTNLDSAKKAIYNNFAAWGNPSAIIFKTFREATKEEITRYVMDDGDSLANLFSDANHPYITICSII